MSAIARVENSPITFVQIPNRWVDNLIHWTNAKGIKPRGHTETSAANGANGGRKMNALRQQATLRAGADT